MNALAKRNDIIHIGYTYWQEDVTWRSQFLFQVSVATYRRLEMLRTMQIERMSVVSVGIVSGLFHPEALRILRKSRVRSCDRSGAGHKTLSRPAKQHLHLEHCPSIEHRTHCTFVSTSIYGRTLSITHSHPSASTGMSNSQVRQAWKYFLLS
jgi:hypothetical protein